MAKYSFTTYGIPKYGEIENTRVYYNVNLRAWSYDYETISLVWGSVTGDPADPFVTHWKVIKSFSGVPNNPYDGVLVDGDVIANYRLSYIDQQTLDEGREVIYSFWVFNGIKWINCGSAQAIFVDSTDTLNKVSKWIPRAWLNLPGDATGEPEIGDFYNTLSAFVFEYDKFRTEAELLLKSSDYDYLPSVILRNKIADLGFNYEPSLGDQYHRSLYSIGNLVNAVKGTSAAVRTYTTALTHWSNTVEVGHNLMLDYNDSSFEESIGRWVTTAGHLDHEHYADSLANFGITILPPAPGLYDVLFPPRNKGFAHVHGHNAAVTLSLPNPTQSKILYGIPINPNTRYIFTGWVRTKESNKVGTVQARISWHSSEGTVISTESYNSALSADTTWKEFNSGSTAGRNGKLSPTNAAYASVDILVTPTNNQAEFFIDMLQFCEARYSLEYQDARLIQIVVDGQKENLIPNPAFDASTAGWIPLNATLIPDFNAPTSAIVYGNSVAKLTATSDFDRIAIVSEWITVDPGQSYTFSIYASGNGHVVAARIEYSVPQSADEQTLVLSDEDGFYYPTTPYIVDSTPVTLTPTAQRISVSSIAPVYTADAGKPLAKVSVYVDTADAGDVFYFDAAQFEQSSTVDAFFTGSGAPTPPNPITQTFFDVDDCRWETRSRINFVPNPSIETTDSWTAGVGTTFTSVTEASTILFGNKHGKVSKAGGGSVSTTAYLPSAAIGGEDVIVSAYVRNKAGTFSISTPGQPVGIFVISESNKDQWTRIYTTRILAAGETSFNIDISLSTGNGSAAVFYLDGVQAEYGRVPTKFIDPAIPETITRENTNNASVSMYLTKSESRNGGKSLYWSTYSDKFIRLYETLSLVTPNGSTWSIVPDTSTTEYPDLTDSLIPSASFENDLGEWLGISATLTRSVPRGTLFDETCTHGTAFCRVSSTSNTSFGLVTPKIYIRENAGYYTSVAVRPENVDAYGMYSIKMTIYDELDQVVNFRTSTVSVRRSDRWAYLSTYMTAVETTNAIYAKVEITALPDTPEPGHTFHVDRAVFRE